MKTQNKNNWKKAAAIAGAALIVGLTAGAVMHPFSPSQADLNKAVSQAESEAFNAGAASVEPIEKFVKVEVPVEVVKEVPVQVEVVKVVPDMATEQALCDRLMYEDQTECVREVKAEDKALEKAWAKLEKELSDKDFLEELEDEGLIADKDEVRIVKYYGDYEEVEVVNSDYDDDEYEFVLKAKLDDEEADEKVKVLFSVIVEDGEAEIVDYQLE
jgi:hypothetical protein